VVLVLFVGVALREESGAVLEIGRIDQEGDLWVRHAVGRTSVP
jgi:hypothetical protein